MILWIGNSAVLKSSSQWQLKELWKLNNFSLELFSNWLSMSYVGLLGSVGSVLCNALPEDILTWCLLFIFVGIALTHYQSTNFRLFQTERDCRRQFQIWQRWQKVIQTGRKHRGKRRNCSLRAISPFPTVFSKGLFPWGVKRCHCVGMG